MKIQIGKGVKSLFDISNKTYFLCDVKKIIENPWQPRNIFEENSLKELSKSIKIHGVLQPIVVKEKQDKFQLLFGERRLIAAKLAGLTTIPVIVMNGLKDVDILEKSIVENMYRKDLTCIEKAKGFKLLVEKFNYTHKRLAQRFHMKRSTLTNYLRILKLPEEILKFLLESKITLGHAKILLGINESFQQDVLRLIIQKKWSVKKTEEYCKKLNQGPLLSEEKTEYLSKYLNASCSISKTKKHGYLKIKFNNEQHLNNIFSKIMRNDYVD